MRRVAFFIDTFAIGGAETVALNLCAALSKETDYQPVIIHFNAKAITKKCQQLGLEEVSAPGHRFYKKTITLPLFAFIFAKFIRQQKIHVLHSHLYGPIVASAPAAWLAGIQHIGTLHDTYTITERPSRIRLLQLASFLKTKLITVSQQMEGYYRQAGKFSTTNLQTIYNGVNIEHFANTSNKNLRAELNIAADEIVIICIARLVQLKRHDILLQAFNQIASNKHVRLLIVGEGPERSKLEKQISTFDKKIQVTLLGERNDVSELLKIADIFSLTSDTEGLSCSILEAMAAGLPIVASHVGGNFELVDNNINGFLVKAGDPKETSEKLQQLVNDADLRTSFGTQSAEKTKNKFNWNTTFSQYKNLYEL